MEFGAWEMLEVNRELLDSYRENSKERLSKMKQPIFLSVATWGRGAQHEILQKLQPYSIDLGYNGSVVACLELKELQELSPEWSEKALECEGEGYLELGVVFKEVFAQRVAP